MDNGPAFGRGRGSDTAQRDVTARQLELLRVIADHQGEYGFAPTIREIGDKMGIKSTNAVVDALESLTLKGCVDRISTTARSIQLTPKARELLGVSSLDDAAKVALVTLDALAAKPLGEVLDRRVTAARAALRKAGVR